MADSYVSSVQATHNKSMNRIDIALTFKCGDPDSIYTRIYVEHNINNKGWTENYDAVGTRETQRTISDWAPIVNTPYTTLQYRARISYPNPNSTSGYDLAIYTPYVYSNTLTRNLNSPPTAPPYLNVPTAIYGGSSCYINWGASTDPDGNLGGYILERYLNGDIFRNVYSGPNTYYTDYIGTGYNTVIYRVRAYDLNATSSGYTNGDARSIINNSAPTMPSVLNVPKTVRGGQEIAVSWGASTDADGNLSGYILQRQINGGSWTQVYKGANRSHADAADPTWNTVAYRVCAYDSFSAMSAYKTSSVISIVNNAVPVITVSDDVSEDMGTQTGAFSFSYSVSDEDESDVITVIEAVDGVEKRSFTAESGKSYVMNMTAAEWVQILNGSHSLTITATDTHEGTAVKTFTFDKNETEIELTLAEPLPADAQIWRALISIVRQIPEGASFQAEVCNNAFDETPVWEDITQSVKETRKFFFANTVKTAENWGFNFRLRVKRLEAQGDCYVESVGGNFE